MGGGGGGGAGTFGYDVNFLKKYQNTIVLQNEEAMLAVCPAYQGRVMTSSARGEAGLSFGWINYKLIESAEIPAHIYPVGGEDRFWLGPEGGQFSIYFKSGAPFDFESWQTPPPIDTEPFDLVKNDEYSALFTRSFELTNYSDTKFNIRVDRKISLLSSAEIQNMVPVTDELSFVAYESENTITNTGENPWTNETGALSIWILGMFNPSESTTIIIPYKTGDEGELGPIVNDSYFGKVPTDRLIVQDGLIFFRGDGKYRSKIGLNPRRALSMAGSYDEKNGVLTIVTYTKPEGVDEYVNSMWELQEEPFSGDAINSYNDGPVDGNMMGPFYELETSSPAAFLAPNESLTHTHRTIHIQGDEGALDKVVMELFKTDLKSIKAAF
ncbi:MAG: DUF6786 family protein [Cyclobacteriaceae bacterium]|nr:DUF6786 family protein [Cyclobacteriaceae bacterium]